ncbi:ABC transporter ATP-binding protein [Paenibacillus senegalensis]|uniref:ABC transporter ATP-binding protein n=1 Tax=Paenibacillus senegalensis TaxID=1465766 RepID=UPI00028A114C|nr:ABC transporter ATP-binding protein [Paenibacillus senegalensis]
MGITVAGLTFDYKQKQVLKDIGFTLNDGEMLGLLGPNGAGKSTLLKCLNRILTATAGVVRIDGKDIAGLKQRELARHLGYVPQSTHAGFPLSVFDAVLIGRTPYVHFKITEKDREIAMRMLALLDLEPMAFRKFNELSGGERQRVFIARALAQEPRVILLDEPTSYLDLKHQLETLARIREIVKHKRICAIMAIHDLNLAYRYCDQVVLLKDGRICSHGKPGEALTEEQVSHVYGVEANIFNGDGIPYIVASEARQQVAN